MFRDKSNSITTVPSKNVKKTRQPAVVVSLTELPESQNRGGDRVLVLTL